MMDALLQAPGTVSEKIYPGGNGQTQVLVPGYKPVTVTTFVKENGPSQRSRGAEYTGGQGVESRSGKRLREVRVLRQASSSSLDSRNQPQPRLYLIAINECESLLTPLGIHCFFDPKRRLQSEGLAAGCRRATIATSGCLRISVSGP